MQDLRFTLVGTAHIHDSDVAGVLEVKTLLDELGRPQPDLFRDLRPALFVVPTDTPGFTFTKIPMELTMPESHAGMG